MDIVDVEVVDDLTPQARCDVGFLKLRRLRIRNVYADGTRSEPYACDVMSRSDVDAVTVVLYGGTASRGLPAQVEAARAARREAVALPRGDRGRCAGRLLPSTSGT